MIMQIAIGIFLAWILIVTMEFWFPVVFWFAVAAFWVIALCAVAVLIFGFA